MKKSLSNIFKLVIINKEDENKYKANYMSIYNRKSDYFDYYIHTLLYRKKK